MSATAPSSARRAPLDLGGWVRYFRLVEIPVLGSTADALEELRLMEDDVDARMLAEVIELDPLMSLKLLAHAATQGGNRRLNHAETVLEALVLMGISPFFRVFGPQPTVDQHLAEHPQARAGLARVLERARRAARFSALFAVQRGDTDAAVLQGAALLHDFTEMLLWLHAPDLALEIRQRQHADPTLRSAAIQRELLGAELNEIQHALMLIWHLPELLVRVLDDRQAGQTQVRNVLLAIQLARHTTEGWHNPALPDDLGEIGQLLHLGTQHVLELVRGIDE